MPNINQINLCLEPWMQLIIRDGHKNRPNQAMFKPNKLEHMMMN